MKRYALAAMGLILTAAFAGGCSSVEAVRMRSTVFPSEGPGRFSIALQARCTGFYLGTLGIPDCDLDKVVNGLLAEAASKLGAEQVQLQQLEGTPEHGIWWLTKLLWFRGARVSATAIVDTRDRQPASLPAGKAASSGRDRTRSTGLASERPAD